MTSCSHCEGIEAQFGRKKAEKELRRLRRRGPIRSTQRLIGDLLSTGVANASLLDIGGGVGAIHHALLDDGAHNASQVDVSAEHINAARDEVARRNHVRLARRAREVSALASSENGDIIWWPKGNVEEPVAHRHRPTTVPSFAKHAARGAAPTSCADATASA
jgi:2-polyprenyl-3-methyl-5-hydroxy-6-metoxy-1,4-benzoquinol methylase